MDEQPTAGAEIFKIERTRAGKTLEDVALAVGVTEGAAWQWEDGRTTPGRNRAIKIDQYLAADGRVLTGWGYAIPTPNDGDDVRREERRVLVASARGVAALLRDAIADGREDLRELLDELQSALRTVR